MLLISFVNSDLEYYLFKREEEIQLWSPTRIYRLINFAQWVDQNNIKVNVDKTFSLEACKALDYLKDLHPRGKIVLAV